MFICDVSVAALGMHGIRCVTRSLQVSVYYGYQHVVANMVRLTLNYQTSTNCWLSVANTAIAHSKITQGKGVIMPGVPMS